MCQVAQVTVEVEDQSTWRLVAKYKLIFYFVVVFVVYVCEYMLIYICWPEGCGAWLQLTVRADTDYKCQELPLFRMDLLAQPNAFFCIYTVEEKVVVFDYCIFYVWSGQFGHFNVTSGFIWRAGSCLLS